MFDLGQWLKEYAAEIGGQFTSLSAREMAIIVPVTAGRFQTVILHLRQINNCQILSFTSKICPATPELNYQSLLANGHQFSYSRFYIHEGYLQVEALALAVSSPPVHILKMMVQEAAAIADQYERKLTGRDIQ